MLSARSSSFMQRVAAMSRIVATTTRAVSTVEMPSLSPTMTQGTISSWKAKPGDVLKPGDILCEIETDKATLGFEIQDESVLAKILIEAHVADIPVGKAIAVTVEDTAAYEEFLKSGGVVNIPAAPTATATATTAAVPTAPAAAPAATATHKSSVAVSPAARVWIDKLHMDASRIVGTGKHGMIVKGDVILAHKGVVPSSSSTPSAVVAAVNSTAVAPTTPSVATSTSSTSASVSAALQASLTSAVNDKFTDVPCTTMRKVIAKRLGESKSTVPHSYAIAEVNLDAVLALRQTLKKKYEMNVSVNDFVIKASALALRDVPQVNAKWDSKNNCIVPSNDVDISVAVATPNGLITPILFSADKRGLSDINKTVKDLATRAKDNKLKPEEFQGGSFSISNLGMFGVSFFSAVINPPQACILAVGAGVPRVVPHTTTTNGTTTTTLRNVTTVQVQLSHDRRVVDERTASLFLQTLQHYLSDTNALLL